jgi:hypothetical protein
MIQIVPPKPDVRLDPGPYRLLNQRCSYHDCNRLYTIAERRKKIYCSEDCQEKSKSYRRKLERAGLAQEGTEFRRKYLSEIAVTRPVNLIGADIECTIPAR